MPGAERTDDAGPPQIPDHRLLRCIGEGSYGEVWLAKNVIGTFRAVKIVYRRNFEDARPFEREFSGIKRFEPISRGHEGLVDILQVGRDDEAGYFYYVMEVADDAVSGQEIHPDTYVPKTLALEIHQRTRLTFEECLEQGLSLSAALGHLHKHGLIHRDIKPSNIIYVEGKPKLADIGLVADVSEARSFVGTEGFIPPEGPGTVQADIFSLGKVLYEAATGKDRHAFPELPTFLGEGAAQKKFLELNEIILKACAPEVKDRHQSTDDLHAELRLLQAGHSVRRLRLLERRLARITKAAAILAVVAVLAGIVAFQIIRDREKEAEIRQRRVGSYVANGARAIEDGNYLGSIPLFTEALKLDEDNGERARAHRVRLASVLNRCPRLAQAWFFDQTVPFVEFSAAGRHLLIATHAQTRVFDIASGQPVSDPISYPFCDTASFSPDGSRVVVSGGSEVIVFGALTGTLLLKLPHPVYTYSARYSPEGNRIVTACGDNKAYIWDAYSGARLFTLEKHTDHVQYAEFSHNGRYVVTAGRDGVAWLWNASDGTPLQELREHRSWVYFASFSPDDQFVATGSFDQRALLWKVPSGEKKGRPFEHPAAVRSVQFTPDGRFLVTACWDQTVRVWDLVTGRPVPPHLNHSSKVVHAAVSPEGRRIASGTIDGSVRVWDLALPAHSESCSRAALSPDGQCYVLVSNRSVLRFDAAQDQLRPPVIETERDILHVVLNLDGSRALIFFQPETDDESDAQLWNTVTGTPSSPLFPVGSTNLSLWPVLSEDGTRLVLVRKRNVALYDTVSGRAITRALGHSASVHRAIFNHAGSLLATACASNVFLWDAATVRPIGPPLSHDREVYQLAFSADDRRLAVACRDTTLDPLTAQLWDTATWQRVGPPLPHQDGVLNVAFGPDGQSVATSGEDDVATVWDAATGARLTPPLRHFGEIHGLAFSPDGRWIATAGRDRTARVWDARTGEPLTPPLPDTEELEQVAFVAGGQRLVVTSRKQDQQIWDLPEDAHDLEDLATLGQLLACATTHFSGGLMPLSKAQLKAAWQRLRDRRPHDFLPTEQDIQNWHLRLARASEAQADWFAAVFHLQHLLQLTPDQPALRRRYEAALAAWTNAPPR